MKSTLLFFALCTLIIPLSNGQDEKPISTDQSSYVNNVGAFAGASGGLGLSYRYFGQRFGIQVATTPILADDHTYLSFGLTALYSINKGRNTQLYSYFGHHYMYEMNEYGEYNYATNTYEEHKTEDKTRITGIGLGFEIVAGQRVGFNFQFGYAYYNHSADDWNTGFDGGAGIYYKF